MTRRESREQAFVLVFEKVFRDDTADEIIESAIEAEQIADDEYSFSVFKGVYDNLERIDGIISQKTKGWSINRISKVSLAVLRVAVYEMLFVDNVPSSVAINEAVELLKKFATKDDASFVNGILGTVASEITND